MSSVSLVLNKLVSLMRPCPLHPHPLLKRGQATDDLDETQITMTQRCIQSLAVEVILVPAVWVLCIKTSLFLQDGSFWPFALCSPS